MGQPSKSWGKRRLFNGLCGSAGGLKIDRSFVTGLTAAPERLALVNAMVLLAQAMGLRVVCEGVETEAERDTLRELGCDLVQGFGIERPIPLPDLAARWLGEGERAVA